MLFMATSDLIGNWVRINCFLKRNPLSRCVFSELSLPPGFLRGNLVNVRKCKPLIPWCRKVGFWFTYRKSHEKEKVKY